MKEAVINPRRGEFVNFRTDKLKKACEIFKQVCSASGITIEQILSDRRLAKIHYARCVVSYRLRHECNMKDAEIGEIMNRNRITIREQINNVDHRPISKLLEKSKHEKMRPH